MTIAFYVNETKSGAAETAAELRHFAETLGLATTDGFGEADVIAVLGGDGTILHAAHDLPERPLLGLNLGGLGYLAAVERGDFEKALSQIAAGDYRISQRTMLSVTANGNAHLALNDVVIVREMTGHAACLDLAVNGSVVSRYLADGLVFATPTGSTAYSLSAGGPILTPDSGSVVVTPMNPHALGARPLVTADTVSFTVEVSERQFSESERMGVYADGERVCLAGAGERIEISKAGRKTLLVEPAGFDSYHALSRKLGWSGTSCR